MSLQDLFDECPNDVDLLDNFTVQWSLTGFGFGEFRFYVSGETSQLRISNEGCSKDTIKAVLHMLVDKAELDC